MQLRNRYRDSADPSEAEVNRGNGITRRRRATGEQRSVCSIRRGAAKRRDSACRAGRPRRILPTSRASDLCCFVALCDPVSSVPSVGPDLAFFRTAWSSVLSQRGRSTSLLCCPSRSAAMRTITAFACALILGALVADRVVIARASCGGLSTLSVPHATITRAVAVEAGAFPPPDAGAAAPRAVGVRACWRVAGTV